MNTLNRTEVDQLVAEALEPTEVRATSPLFQKLLAHLGHPIEIAVYGERGEYENVAVECTQCHVVLIDENA